MRGRKPEPAELKILRGTPGHRRLPAAVPGIGGVPEAPEGLSEAERAEWDQVVSAMSVAGTLSLDNGATIEIHIRNLCRMRQAEAHVAAHGAIVSAPRTGIPMRNPHLKVADDAAALVIKTARELGLTPSARGRVSASEVGKDDEIGKKYFG